MLQHLRLISLTLILLLIFAIPIQPTVYSAGYSAVLFDDTDDYIVMDVAKESNFDFDLDEPFSFDWWWKPSAANLGTQMAFFFKNGDNDGIHMKWNGSELWLYLYGVGDGNRKGVGTAALPKAGVWNHIAVTFNGNSDDTGIQFYYDGVLQSKTASDNDGVPGTIKNNNPLTFGIYKLAAPVATRYAKGEFDEIRVWKICLAAIQVDEIAHTQYPNDFGFHTDTDLVLNLHCDEEDGELLKDSTSLANHCTTSDIAGRVQSSPSKIVIGD